jgi:hypothetical protein
MLLNIFSGSLFLLPILVTLGVYVGVENQKVLKVVQGKPPPGVNPDGTQKIIQNEQYCQKAYGIEPYPYRYICKYFFPTWIIRHLGDSIPRENESLHFFPAAISGPTSSAAYHRQPAIRQTKPRPCQAAPSNRFHYSGLSTRKTSYSFATC